MLLVYLLVCLVPVALIVVVFGVIGVAVTKVVMAGKQAYAEIRPDINELREKAARAQRKGLEFSERSQNISKTFEEISGRWAFVSKSLAGAEKSPVVKLAGIAGKLLENQGKG